MNLGDADAVEGGLKDPVFDSQAIFRALMNAFAEPGTVAQFGTRVMAPGPLAPAAAAILAARGLVDALTATPARLAIHGISVSQDGVRRSAFDLLSYPHIDAEGLQVLWPDLGSIRADVLAQIEADAKYSVYLDRQADDVERARADEALLLASTLDYGAMPGLSRELSDKLTAIRPGTLAQAQRIEGMTPAALTVLMARAASAPRAQVAATAITE